MLIVTTGFRAASLCRKRLPSTFTTRTAVASTRRSGEAGMESAPILHPSTTDDLKGPLGNLDRSLQCSHMSYVELSLFRKHAKHLEADQQRNIYDIIDGIEWNTLTTEAHLEKALRMLSEPLFNGKALTDCQVAVLLSATGRRCQMLSLKQRNDYTARLLHVFNVKGVSLGLAARNALLGTQIDNQVDVDAVETLKQYEMNGLIPDGETYGQLSRIYAQKADVHGIVEIIGHVRNIGLKVPDQVLESMVYALARSGQDERAKVVIGHVSDNVVLANGLRNAYALAKAELSEDESMFEILDGIENVSTSMEEYLLSMHEILFTLAKKGNLTGIEKLKTIFPPRTDANVGKQWGSVVQSKILRYINGEESNIAAAALLLDFIPDIERRSRMRKVLMKVSSSAIYKQQDIAEAVKMCTVFQKCQLLKHPLRIYLRDVALNNPERFHDLFEIYQRTEDFAEVQDRPHLQLPIAVLCFKKLLKADAKEEKVELFAKIAHHLHCTGVASCGDKYFANVRDLLIAPLLKDTNILSDLMQKLEGDKDVQCFVVDMLITQLLDTRQMQLLQTLLHGTLKTVTAGEAFPCQKVKNIILDSSVYSRSLVPACSLLRLLFSPSGENCDYQYKEGLRIIEAAVISSDLRKLKVLCEIWSKDERIRLRKADKDELSQTLDRKGEHLKKLLVACLLQKNRKGDLLETTDAKRIRNKKSGSSVRVVAVKYEFEKSPKTASSRRVGVDLRLALSDGDLEKAKQIWVTGSEHAPVALGLSLAERLYFAKSTDQFKFVLLKLKEIHDDMSYHVLTAYDSSDASDERMTFLDEVAKLLNLHPDVRQQLIYNTRVSAFYKLIESSDLNKALDISKVISAQKNSVFGQLDLMGAAIDKDNTTVITEVLNLIRAYHGKESSMADFCVALLERHRRAQAQRLIQSSTFRLSGPKLNYYIDREIDLNRMEVILDLFELCTAEGNLQKNDLEVAVSKIVSYYGKRKNRALINLLEERLKSMGIRLSEEVNALLLKSKRQDFR